MKSRNYRVNRSNIYIGEVIRADSIPHLEEDGQLHVGVYYPYRSMLFVPDEEKLSNDLLYQSPSYPILNVTKDNTCLSLERKSIVIKDAFNLATLLKHFGYDQYLTYEDIMMIRETYFTGEFAKDNCELFGWKESKPEDYTYYKNGVEVTDPKELKRRIAQERRSQQAGHRSFYRISESILPSEYWDVLNKLGDRNLINAFNPCMQEGQIKKLRRF